MILNIITYILSFFVLVNIILFFVQLFIAIHKYFFLREINLLDKYGNNSYVAITGASSGQGKEFAIQFAKRGFNLLLIGSKKSYKTRKFIKEICPNCKIKIVEVNFCNAYEEDFFNEII